MNYVYSVAVDFTATATPNTGSLSTEILNLTLGMILQGVTLKGDSVTIEFDGTLSGMDQTALNTAVSTHTGIASTETIMETIMMVPTARQILNPNDWQDLGGVVVSPSSFPAEKQNIKAQITGEFKIKSGMDAELVLTETGAWNGLPDVELISPAHVLSNSGDTWVPFIAYSNVEVRDGFWSYVLKARALGCDGFYLRYMTLSIIESIQQ